MNRREFSIGALLALLCTGASMSPENERRAVNALERIAKAMEEGNRASAMRTSTMSFGPQERGELEPGEMMSAVVLNAESNSSAIEAATIKATDDAYAQGVAHGRRMQKVEHG